MSTDKELNPVAGAGQEIPVTPEGSPQPELESVTPRAVPLVEDRDQCFIPGVERKYVQTEIYSVVKDIALVKDIESEVTMNWNERKFHLFWPPIKFRRAYVMKMARNAALEHIRRRGREERVYSDLKVIAGALQQSADGVMEQLSNEDLVRHLLDGLPAECVDTLIRKQQLGYSVDEIAEKFGLTKKQVRANLARVAYAMAQRIEKYKAQLALAGSPADSGQE